MAPDRRNDDYFRLPALHLMIGVIVGIYIMVCCLHAPGLVPFAYMGPLGTFVKYLASEQPWLINSLIGITVVIHTAYLPYIALLCRKKGISSSAEVKWMISTLIFGGTSLYHIQRYEPKQA